MLPKYLLLWRHLAPNHRLGAAALVLGNFAAAFVEVLGVALFGLVLLRITAAESVPANFSVFGFPHDVAGASLRSIVLACGAVYVAKNTLMAGLAWLEARLAFGVQTHLSLEVLGSLLRQDYEETSNADGTASANLLIGGMGAISQNLLVPGLTLLAEGTLMLALVAFLLVTQPWFSAGLLGTLAVLTGILVLVSRRLTLKLGLDRHRHDDERLRLLTGIFSHLREMYIYSAGPRAVVHLERQLSGLGRASRGFQLLNTMPRFALETALVTALLVVVFLHLRSGLAPTLVVSIGVFGVVGFRLLLGINRIVASVQGMRFAGSIVQRVAAILTSPPAPAASGRGRGGAADGSLRLQGVTYAYRRGGEVLHGVDLELPRRSLIAVKGRSGAGKSTLLEIMAGLRAPTAGHVELDGVRIDRKAALVGRVAYAGQQPAVFPDTVRANVAFGVAPEQVDDQAVWRALGRAHLDDVVRSLPGQLDFVLGRAHGLSGGQVQRLALARALYIDCDYLLLDEPSAALDADTEQQLLATFRELSATTGVLIVSHREAPLRIADAVWVLVDGRLVTAEGSAPLEPAAEAEEGGAGA
jgi:ATP-binding cassette, subfamily B, bacterial PglK